MSPTAAVILSALSSAAEQGAPCPSNPALARLARTHAGYVGRVVSRLEEGGLIRIHKTAQNRRAVEIVATGLRSASTLVGAKAGRA